MPVGTARPGQRRGRSSARPGQCDLQASPLFLPGRPCASRLRKLFPPSSRRRSVVGFRGSLESPGATVQCEGRGQERQRRVCGKRARRAASGSEKPSGLSLGPAAFTAAARLRPRACKPRMLSYFQVGATFHEAWKAHGLRMSVPHKGRWGPSRTCLLGDRPWSLSRYQEHSSTGPVAPESREERLSPPRALCTPARLGAHRSSPVGLARCPRCRPAFAPCSRHTFFPGAASPPAEFLPRGGLCPGCNADSLSEVTLSASSVGYLRRRVARGGCRLSRRAEQGWCIK